MKMNGDEEARDARWQTHQTAYYVVFVSRPES